MRSAAAASYWRAIDKSPKRPVEIRRFQFRDLAGVSDGEITFTSPITAICGLSGTGKSALLRAIWAVLDWNSANQRIEVKNRLSGAALRATIVVEDVDFDNSIIVDDDRLISTLPMPIQVLHFDPSIVAGSLQQKFGSLRGLPGLLDAYEPIEFTAEEVGTIAFVARKDYRSIRIYEIDEFEGEVLPFAQINDGRHSYDTRTMSLGEISIILCFWALRRAERGAIFLAEEPETYISPSSQAALMEYLASVCVTKQIFMVLTTHSPPMVAALGKTQVKFLYQTPQGSRVAVVEQDSVMRKVVGLERKRDMLLLVEDRAAREFAQLLVARLDHSLHLRTEIIDVGGEAKITELRRAFPRSARSSSIVGVYDGDMRDTISAAEGEWPLVFLPGRNGIEQSFRQLSQDHTRIFAEKMGRDLEEFQGVLAGLLGLDPHDWFENAARGFGLTYDQFLMGGFECWLTLDINKEAARRFIAELNGAAA